AVAPADCATGATVSEAAITGTSHPITGLSHETEYSFRICAINANGTPDVSSGAVVTATTDAQSTPPDPSNLNPTVDSASQISLSWDSGGGVTADYRIAYQPGTTAPANCSAGTTIAEGDING